MNIVFIIAIILCAIFSFIAGRKSSALTVNDIVNETVDGLIEDGYLKYDKERDVILKHDES